MLGEQCIGENVSSSSMNAIHLYRTPVLDFPKRINITWMIGLPFMQLREHFGSSPTLSFSMSFCFCFRWLLTLSNIFRETSCHTSASYDSVTATGLEWCLMDLTKCWRLQTIVGTLNSAYNYGCSISGIVSFEQQMQIVEIVISRFRIRVAKIQEVKSEDHLSE